MVENSFFFILVIENIYTILFQCFLFISYDVVVIKVFLSTKMHLISKTINIKFTTR